MRKRVLDLGDYAGMPLLVIGAAIAAMTSRYAQKSMF